ncbi:MAG: hypothetical protein M3O50_00315 [Myxococcota bacterium]|nr:hypothetical protein [Myxococcota bacterium]
MDESANDEPDRRDRLPSTRTRIIRPRTENVGRISHRHLAVLSLEEPPFDVDRPRTRADCAKVARPCPFVGCRYSLYLEVSRNGSIKFRFPDLGPEDMSPEHSCSLDVADLGGVSLQEAGRALNVGRERVRQIEQSGRATLARRHPELRHLLEDHEDKSRAVLEPKSTAPAARTRSTPVAPPSTPSPERRELVVDDEGPPSGEVVGADPTEHQIGLMPPRELRKRVLAILKDGPLTMRAIALAAEARPDPLRAAVRELRQDGLVELVGASSAAKWALVGEVGPAAILEATTAEPVLPSTPLVEVNGNGAHPRAPAMNGAAPPPQGAPTRDRVTTSLLTAYARARRALEERRRALAAELQAIDGVLEGAMVGPATVPTNGSVAQRSPVVTSANAQPSA